MKSRFITLALALVALLAASSLAMARPYGPGGWLEGVPQDKQEQVIKMYQEGRQKLYELESRKWSRQAELNALLASDKPDAGKIEALAKEIGTLSSQAYQERVALHQRIQKETGVKLPLGGPGYGPGGCPMGGAGYGRGGCGPGGGYGPGCGGGGFGPNAGNQALPPCCQTAPGQQPAK